MANKKISSLTSGVPIVTTDEFVINRAGVNYKVSGFNGMALQSPASVAITGGDITGITDLAIADGGTAASTAADARTNLGLAIGTDVLAYSTALSNLSAIGTNGLVVYQGSGIWGSRTLTGTANQITVTNGDGVSGNPTLTLPYDLYLGASASGPSALTFFEDTDNGSNKVTITVPASIAADYTLTLPADDGSSNQVLTTNGSGVLSWSTTSSASGWTYISTASASASATIDFTGLTSTYRAYMIVFDSLVPATDDTGIWFRTSTDGGSTYDSGASNYSHTISGSYTSTAFASGSTGDTKIILSPSGAGLGIDVTDGEGVAAGRIVISKPSATQRCVVTAEIGFISSASPNNSCRVNSSGARDAAADVNAVRIFMSSGNITSGNFTLFGLT